VVQGVGPEIKPQYWRKKKKEKRRKKERERERERERRISMRRQAMRMGGFCRSD
jgi:hypothetical protein